MVDFYFQEFHNLVLNFLCLKLLVTNYCDLKVNLLKFNKMLNLETRIK